MKLTEKLSFAKDTLMLTKTLEKEIYQKLEHHTGSGDDFVYDAFLDCIVQIFDNYLDSTKCDTVEIEISLGHATTGKISEDNRLISIIINPYGRLCANLGVTIDECIAEKSVAHDEYLNNIISEIVKKIVGIFLHELQHWLQSHNSKSETSYRSYTNKNKSNFYDKINNGILDIDYYSSPEEIDAHAVQRISDVISQMKDFDSEEQRRYLTNCFQTIAALGKKYITTTMAGTNQIAIKSRNRYMKKIYIGLKDYLDNHITD